MSRWWRVSRGDENGGCRSPTSSQFDAWSSRVSVTPGGSLGTRECCFEHESEFPFSLGPLRTAPRR